MLSFSDDPLCSLFWIHKMDHPLCTAFSKLDSNYYCYLTCAHSLGSNYVSPRPINMYSRYIRTFFNVFSVHFNTHPVNVYTNPSSLHQLLTLDPMDRKISKNIKIWPFLNIVWSLVLCNYFPTSIGVLMVVINWYSHLHKYILMSYSFSTYLCYSLLGDHRNAQAVVE
jgi:hypothetical protein